MEVIAEIKKKNSKDLVLISLGEFKGHEIFDVRLQYQTAAGDWRPTKKGITLSTDLLLAVTRGLIDIYNKLKAKKEEKNANINV